MIFAKPENELCVIEATWHITISKWELLLSVLNMVERNDAMAFRKAIPFHPHALYIALDEIIGGGSFLISI